MAVMIEERASMMLQEAERLETQDPRRASMLYLDTAEVFIYLSRSSNPYDAQKHIEKATWCYEKSQDLKGKANPTVEKVTQATKLNSGITFKDIGGLEALKDEIRLKIIEPFKYPEIFKKYGKSIGGGILMYGPPGCGKSLIAEATANEAQATFFHVKASDLKSKYVGETEQNIANLFKEARERQPSIIFFDEFEVLGGERGRSDPYTRQAVSQLLTEMDGVGTKNPDDQKILLLAATNEPWNIDIALRRQGRFGQSIFVPAPDYESRRRILQLHLKDKPIDSSVNIHELAEVTEHLSGADLKAVCENATELPLREFIKTKQLRKITAHDFAHAIAHQQSTMASWFKNAYTQVTERGFETLFPELVRAGKDLEENAMIVKKRV